MKVKQNQNKNFNKLLWYFESEDFQFCTLLKEFYKNILYALDLVHRVLRITPYQTTLFSVKRNIFTLISLPLLFVSPFLYFGHMKLLGIYNGFSYRVCTTQLCRHIVCKILQLNRRNIQPICGFSVAFYAVPMPSLSREYKLRGSRVKNYWVRAIIKKWAKKYQKTLLVDILNL